MKKVDILFRDWGISETKIDKVFETEYNLRSLNFINAFRELLQGKSELSKKMRKQIESGEMISNKLLNDFLQFEFKKKKGNFIISHYPRTSEQYINLKKTIKNLNIEIGNIWYIKIKNPEKFIKSYFQVKENKQWLDKYGTEVITNWKSQYDKQIKFINEIRKNTSISEWRIIEMEYVENLNYEYLKEKLKTVPNNK